MRVVELADELQLTTGDTLEICAAAGVPTADASTDLTEAQVDRCRELSRTRETWRDRPELAAAGVVRSGGSGLPPAPWERAGWTAGPATPLPPAVPGRITPLAPAALALAILSLVVPFVPAVAALALAWWAKGRIETSGGRVTGDRLATAAQVVAVVAIAGWAALLALSFYRDAQDDAAGRFDGQIEIGTLGWDEIGTGDCVRVPRGDLAVESWTEVDCAGPHEAEVFATEQVAPTNDTDPPYPGRASLTPGATRACEARFETYVGVPYEQSTLHLAVFFPTPSNWADGDRTLGCIVFRDEHALIDGTLAGSAR